MRHEAKSGAKRAGEPCGGEADQAPRIDWSAAYGVRVAPQEVALAKHVERVMTGARDRLDGPLNDVGPRGPARPELRREEVEVAAYDPAARVMKTTTQQVMRRAPARVLRGLPDGCQAAAREYEGLVERIASIRGPGEGRGGGLSDGGATTRCAWAERLRTWEAVIGQEVVIAQRGVHAHADRGRRAITRLDVVRAVVLDGKGTGDVLARFGWSRKSTNQAALGEALSDALTDLAVHLGLIDPRELRRA